MRIGLFHYAFPIVVRFETDPSSSSISNVFQILPTGADQVTENTQKAVPQFLVLQSRALKKKKKKTSLCIGRCCIFAINRVVGNIKYKVITVFVGL